MVVSNLVYETCMDGFPSFDWELGNICAVLLPEAPVDHLICLLYDALVYAKDHRLT
jgi:hypothetical protein